MSWNNLPDFAKTLKLFKKDLKEADSPTEETDKPEEANLVSSLIGEHNGLEYHNILLDLDVEHAYYPSTTPGHGHLYINKPMPKEKYERLLELLNEFGIIEDGVWKLQWQDQGKTFLRLPGVEKASNEVSSGKKQQVVVNKEDFEANIELLDANIKILNDQMKGLQTLSKVMKGDIEGPKPETFAVGGGIKAGDTIDKAEWYNAGFVDNADGLISNVAIAPPGTEVKAGTIIGKVGDIKLKLSDLTHQTYAEMENEKFDKLVDEATADELAEFSEKQEYWNKERDLIQKYLETHYWSDEAGYVVWTEYKNDPDRYIAHFDDDKMGLSIPAELISQFYDSIKTGPHLHFEIDKTVDNVTAKAEEQINNLGKNTDALDILEAAQKYIDTLFDNVIVIYIQESDSGSNYNLVYKEGAHKYTHVAPKQDIDQYLDQGEANASAEGPGVEKLIKSINTLSIKELLQAYLSSLHPNILVEAADYYHNSEGEYYQVVTDIGTTLVYVHQLNDFYNKIEKIAKEVVLPPEQKEELKSILDITKEEWLELKGTGKFAQMIIEATNDEINDFIVKSSEW